MNLDYKAIGKQIKEMRKRRKLSQAELAEVIEKSTSYISYIEAGQKCMSLDTFVEIANAFAVSTDLLLVEQLLAMPAAASQEITAILGQCNEYERLVLADTIKALHAALLRHRPAAEMLYTQYSTRNR